MKNKILDIESIKIWGERLSSLDNVKKYDEGEFIQGHVIAYSLSELEESFNKFREEYLPKLTKENITDGEIEDILHEMGEEFRHILYHIKDMKYFDYLSND